MIAVALVAGVVLVGEGTPGAPGGVGHQRVLENYNLAYATATTTATRTTTTKTSTTTTSTSSSPTLSQILKALSKALSPTGSDSSINVILAAGGYTDTFTTPEGGTFTISWYYLPKGAKLPSVKRAPVLVAKGKKTFRKAELGTVDIKLTKAGKKLLKRSKTVRLTAKGAFKHGSKTVSSHKSFTLKKKKK